MDAKGRTKVWRRNYFINRRLQSSFMAGFSLVVFLGLLANLLVSYFLIDRELGQGLYKIHIKIRTTSEIAVPILLKLGAVTVPSILAAAGILGFFLIRRIELPLLQFKNAIQNRSKGDFSTDLSENMPGELPAAFNNMSRSLEAVFFSVKESAATLDKESVRLAGAAADRDGMKDALEAIKEARSSIASAISKFKV